MATYSLLLLSVVATLISSIAGQTYSTCNPTQGTCPANPALGTSQNIDFANGAPGDFTATGAPTYDSNGAAFTVAKSGDSPTLASKWYIMFGHVDFVIKAAPGTGIVSSAVLLSDALDEIDWEWLGGDNSQVQSNYFGKGQTVTGYNRGAFHGAQGNHDSFSTYSIDWTADQIVWSINGNTVRVLKASDAEAGQYPQTPMMLKVGSWAGGDSANAPGTITWAGGPVDYSQGPFTMYVKAIAVTDYSTGTSYSYEGTAGTWQSIKSNGGTINSSGSGKNTPSIAESPSYSTAAGNPTVPFETDAAASSAYATRTGYPWVTASASAVTSTPPQYTSSSSALPLGSSSSPALEVKTTYNDQGFLTTLTMTPTAPVYSQASTLAPTVTSTSYNTLGGNAYSAATTTLQTTTANTRSLSESETTTSGVALAQTANEAASDTRRAGIMLAALAFASAVLML